MSSSRVPIRFGFPEALLRQVVFFHLCRFLGTCNVFVVKLLVYFHLSAGIVNGTKVLVLHDLLKVEMGRLMIHVEPENII